MIWIKLPSTIRLTRVPPFIKSNPNWSWLGACRTVLFRFEVLNQMTYYIIWTIFFSNSLTLEQQSISVLSVKLQFFYLDKGLSAILTGQRNLYYLKLKTLPCVTGLCLSQLESLKLRKLVLKNLSNLKDQYVVQVVSNCPTISWVGFQYCRELTDACVMAVAAVLKGNLVSEKLRWSSF